MVICATHYSFHRMKLLTKLYRLRPYSVQSSATFHRKNINVLGIETSCDDTGVAIVDGKGEILGESLHSQGIVHLRYGGVNPLVAQELHRSNIENAVSEALCRANIEIKDIDAISVTTKPGLLVSLQIGVKYAKYLSKKYHKPLIPIHHMEAHALVARMFYDIPFPFLVLLISGGHCQLAVAKDFNDFILLGESLDNAPGEVMDKVARRMKLRNIPEYSKVAGGRAIELAASKAKNNDVFNLPQPLWKYRDCNFSFSGLKDSVQRKLLQKEAEHNVIGDGIIPEVNDLCAAFQLAIAEHLVQRTERAIMFSEKYDLIDTNNRNIVISGGVACNNFLFKSIELIGDKLNYKVYRPPPKLCTDNGVMIAWNGIEKFKEKCDIITNISSIEIEPKALLGRNYIDKVKKANLPIKVRRLKHLYETYFLCISSTISERNLYLNFMNNNFSFVNSLIICI